MKEANKKFSLKVFLLDKAIAYGKPFGHIEINEWKNEAGIIAKKWYLESNAERRFRQLEETHRKLKEEGVDLDSMIGGMIVKLSEKPLTYIFRKSAAHLPTAPKCEDLQPALFEVTDNGKKFEPDYRFTLKPPLSLF